MTGPGDGCTRVARDDAAYPPAVRALLGSSAPESLGLLGDPGLLRLPLTALFCSVRVPPDLVLATYDLARALRDRGVAVVGGFQSPLERECLDFLLRGRRPVVVVPARDARTVRLRPSWREAVKEGRMLLVGPFERVRRPSEAHAVRRNRLVTALAEAVWIAHASPGVRLLRVAAEALAWGRPVRCLPHPANRDLVLLGAAEASPSRQRGIAPADGRERI